MPYADPETRREYMRAYHAKHRTRQRQAEIKYRKTPKGKAAKLRNNAVRQSALQNTRMLGHEFTMVDGEGWDDDFGDHQYMMLIAGEDYLFTGQPLSAWESLDWLAQLPVQQRHFYVTFFFDYDVTMILRDMAKDSPTIARSLFTSREPGKLVWWNGFGLDYRPHKHLTVKKWTDDNTLPAVTLHDVQGFFQSSFVVALEKFTIGTAAQRRRVAEMKAKRDSFTGKDWRQVLTYSQLECKLGAALVSKLRDMTHLAKTNASPYEGPGDMARRALQRHYGKQQHEEVLSRTPRAVQDMARKAYYGGRFEVMAHGPVGKRIYEYDLHSAYPYAMSQLPCFAHAKWHRGQHPDSGGLYLAEIEYDTRYRYTNVAYGDAHPFPQRRKTGHIYYPIWAHGWYWSPEIDTADDGTVNVLNAWWLEQTCTCKPYAWVEQMYLEREALERDHKGSGIALKLMLNTLYGKKAQQKPVPGTFLNLVEASLITSMTRARLYATYKALPPQSVVMFATDAIFTTQRLTRAQGVAEKLGGWELAGTYDDLTIFQPGVYFDGDKAAFKTRGIPKSIFRDNAEALKAIALDFDAKHPVTLETHMGLRLALARNNLTDLGNWVTVEKKMSANPSAKRDPQLMSWGPQHINWSKPRIHSGDISHNGWHSTFIPPSGVTTDVEEGRWSDTIELEAIYDGWL